MALGKRKDEQQEMCVASTDLLKSPGHVFYRKLNQVLAKAEFDRKVEDICEPYYRIGRPGIPPGVYFRMLPVGYYEGIGSQRGIAWRCGDRGVPRHPAHRRHARPFQPDASPFRSPLLIHGYNIIDHGFTRARNRCLKK
jgi:hypothetical protein